VANIRVFHLKGREKMLTPKMKRRIKRELSAEKPTIWVGKEGVAPRIVNEVSRQLDKKEMVKARILKSALKNEDAKNVASKIAQQTSSTLIDIRGHTFILYKRRKKKSEKSL
jgi:RNA-binding protein